MKGVVCVHGISERTDARGFSGRLRRQVETLARTRKLPRPSWREVVWSDLSDLPPGGLLDVADLVADVARYDRDPILRARIIGRIRAELERSAEPVVLVAHSLGSVAVLDYLLETPEALERVSTLVTLGSPLGLSSSVIDYASRAPLARLLLAGLDWVDVWSASDPVHTGGLGGVEVLSDVRGLAELYPCESRPITTASHPLTAHVSYWTSPRVARLVLEAASGGR